MKNNLVAQSNDLVLATYIMTTKEKELLLACISQIDSRPNAPNISKQTKFTVTVEQIRNVFYKNSYDRNLFRDLSDASKRLFNREVTIKLEGNKTLLTRFVSSVLFDPDEAKVTLTFAEEILPYLTQLKANFTKYKLIEVSELSSTHAIRLYELIVCWIGQYQYSKTLDLDDFRYVMGVSGKYKQFGQLREYVIDKAIEEINKSTTYKISVDYRKVKRSYISLTLKFHKKVLEKFEDKEGLLSEEKIASIVRTNQFVADYNDYHRLSHNGKMNTDDFRQEMRSYLKTYPEEFLKRPLGDYLNPITN
ncbi:replication initiation protein [uncultured Psychrobacter sp.]|uniref:replication initiation protein n=1 Tax=uncultured Psychrobacter sp. TaxID=259303 RepID=UPI002599F764|nr:replication initiation protein [uncultured Psychrobacter sp.]